MSNIEELVVEQGQLLNRLCEIQEQINNISSLKISEFKKPKEKLLTTEQVIDETFNIWNNTPNKQNAFFQILKYCKQKNYSNVQIVEILRFNPLKRELNFAGFGSFFTNPSKQKWYFETVEEWLK